MSKPPEYCRYSSLKVDSDLLYRIRQAAAKAKKTTQEWLSDAINEATARDIGDKPIRRKQPKPRSPNRPAAD